MSACKKVLKIKHRVLCLSDLTERIKLQKRTLTSADFDDADPTEKFVDLRKLWAAVETDRGYRSFNGVGTNTDGGDHLATHNFYIRYLAGCSITKENWIEWKCNKYQILSVENLDGLDEFIRLKTVKHGCKNLEANQA